MLDGPASNKERRAVERQEMRLSIERLELEEERARRREARAKLELERQRSREEKREKELAKAVARAARRSTGPGVAAKEPPTAAAARRAASVPLSGSYGPMARSAICDAVVSALVRKSIP